MGTAPALGSESSRRRVVSIDIFRGMTMLVMLFVNDLGNVRDVPAWMKHMPAEVDGMTFVDVVFPAFLFIVGACIPIALGKRLSRGESPRRVWAHVLVRSAGLIAIGLCMVNTYRFHPTAMLVSPGVWELAFFTAVIIVWNRYPRTASGKDRLFAALRFAGAAVLVLLVILYRGDSDGHITWMRTSWWGILTGIGLAYFLASTAYLLLPGRAGLIGVLALLTALNIGDRAGALAGLDLIRPYFSIGGMLGGYPSIALAGTVAGTLFAGDAVTMAPWRRIRWLLVFAAGLYAGGALLRPLHGLSKLAMTPAWCLICAAICCVILAFVYWLADHKGVAQWARFVRPGGDQPLLAYILPHIVYSLFAVMGVTVLQEHLNAGVPGIVRSAVFALAIITLTGILGRLGVLLRL